MIKCLILSPVYGAFCFSWHTDHTFSCNIGNVDLGQVRHVSKNHENDEPREETGTTVDAAGNQCISAREERNRFLKELPLKATDTLDGFLCQSS